MHTTSTASSLSVHTPFPIGQAIASSTSTSTSASTTSTTKLSLITSTFTTLTSSSSTSTSTSTSASSMEMSTSSPTSSIIPSTTGVINPGNEKYSYYGCYNETTALNNTSGRRALYGGSMEALDTMTVDLCLDFCNIDGFAYGGLEYTDECWCAPYLNVFAAKLPDSECDFACKGNNSELCGGALKLSVYHLNNNTTSSPAPRTTNVPTKLFIAGLAIAGLVLEML